MKRRLQTFTVAALLAAALTVPAGASNFDHCADALKELGLFQGTNEGYMLDRAPTRAEAATMLVRLLGKEADAQELEYTAPFTDLQDWEKPYVQYLYDNGLTSGVSETLFSPETACSAQMYTTFLLRALGYSESQGDFTYNDAVDFATDIGLVDAVNLGTDTFLRDNVVAMSYTALNTLLAGDEDTSLLDKLTEDNVIDTEKAAALQSNFDTYQAYVDACTSLNEAKGIDMSADIQATVKMGETKKAITLTMPLTIQYEMQQDTPASLQMAMVGSVKMKVDESLVGLGKETSDEQEIAYYMADGVFYMNLGGSKVKMALPLSELLQQLGGAAQMKKVEPLSMVQSMEQSGNKITLTYSAASLNELANKLLAQMQLPTIQGELTPEIGSIVSTVTLSKGQVSQMNMSIELSLNGGTSAMSMSMTIAGKINSLGNDVKVTLPDDLDSYEDMLPML